MNKSGPGGTALTVNIDAGDEYIPARRETLTCAPRWWILITDATAVSSTDDCSPCRLSRKNWLNVDCWSDPDDCWWPAGSESDYNCWSKRDEFISICTQTGYYNVRGWKCRRWRWCRAAMACVSPLLGLAPVPPLGQLLLVILLVVDFYQPQPYHMCLSSYFYCTNYQVPRKDDNIYDIYLCWW